jgi:hypothetical protein
MAESERQRNIRRIIAIHQDALAKIYPEAIKEASACCLASCSHLQRESERPGRLHVHVRQRVRENFSEETPGVRIIDKPGRPFCLELDGAPYDIPDKLLAKFKKYREINGQLVTSGIPTKSVIQFNNQDPDARRPIQEPLFEGIEAKGTAEPAHLNLGYITDETWLGLARVSVTFPTGMKTAQLILDLPTVLAEDGATVEQFPIADIEEVQPKNKRVRARRPKPADEAEAPDQVSRRIKKEAPKNTKSAKDKKASNDDPGS